MCTVCISSLLRVQVFRDNREAQFGRWQLGEATKHAAGKVTGTVEDVMNARVPNLLNELNSKSFHPHYCYRWAECRPHTYIRTYMVGILCIVCCVLFLYVLSVNGRHKFGVRNFLYVCVHTSTVR